jgi:tRNA U54 and U55 pseudouridine synthase Pus10
MTTQTICKCGTPLSQYNHNRECFSCQDEGLSVDEIVENAMAGIEESKSKQFIVDYYSPKPLSPETWEWVKENIESVLRAANQQVKIRVKENRP